MKESSQYLMTLIWFEDLLSGYKLMPLKFSWVEYYGCGRDTQQIAIFMEFLPGGSMAQYIKQSGGFLGELEGEFTSCLSKISRLLDGIL